MDFISNARLNHLRTEILGTDTGRVNGSRQLQRSIAGYLRMCVFGGKIDERVVDLLGMVQAFILLVAMETSPPLYALAI